METVVIAIVQMLSSMLNANFRPRIKSSYRIVKWLYRYIDWKIHSRIGTL